MWGEEQRAALRQDKAAQEDGDGCAAMGFRMAGTLPFSLGKTIERAPIILVAGCRGQRKGWCTPGNVKAAGGLGWVFFWSSGWNCGVGREWLGAGLTD